MRKREVVCGSAIEQKFRGSGSAEKETILSTDVAGANDGSAARPDERSTRDQFFGGSSVSPRRQPGAKFASE
jgi:hypothetical protein